MNNTCCFTGHRNIPKDDLKFINKNLKIQMYNLYKDGVRVFASGGAIGFDTLAALTVLKMKEKYPDVELHLILPCRTQTVKWKAEDIVMYENIKSKADKVVYVSDDYKQNCMLERNKYLVSMSTYCIAYLRYNRSGTSFTVNYAKKHGKTVLYI